MNKDFKPSKYQENIYDFIGNKNGNAVVSAVAGSGKTTTLINAIDIIPSDKNILFLAFNKSIASELVKKIPSAPNVTIKTVHAFGMAMITSQLPFSQQAPSKYKTLLREIISNKNLSTYNLSQEQYELVNNLKVDEDKKIQIDNMIDYINIIATLTDLGRMNLVDIQDSILGIQQLCNIAKHHGIITCNQECTSAWYLIKLGSSITNIIDFTDMIYLPIIHNLESPKFDIVFIDECQDINASQRQIMMNCLEPNNGRFIAVGDENQAIYGFAGADADSFKKLCQIPNTILLPLSVSYRCSTDIIDKVKAIVPNIEAKPEAIKGQVEYLRSYKDVKANDMVLCRQTFPLVSLCLLYLSNDVKAYVNGSDIGKALAKMILDTKQDNGWTTQIMFSMLYSEREKLTQSVITKENLTREEALDSPTVTNYTEKIKVIELLSNNVVSGSLNDPQTIVDKINKIFSDEDNNGIMLSTIHKAKGLEANRVFIIHEDLMPSKHATKQWELQQERNLMYVAFTRAKSYLGFISDFDAFKTHKSEENNVTPIVQSKHLGTIGDRIHVKAEVYSVKDVTTKYGESIVIEMKDDNGNVLTKFGDINSKYITSNHRTITNGTKINLMGVIKGHKEFKGVKSTVIGLR